MVSLLWHCGEPEAQEATMWIMGKGEETSLSAVRPCEMGVPPNEALDTSESPHLTIGYLLRVKCRDLEFQVGWLR